MLNYSYLSTRRENIINYIYNFPKFAWVHGDWETVSYYIGFYAHSFSKEGYDQIFSKDELIALDKFEEYLLYYQSIRGIRIAWVGFTYPEFEEIQKLRKEILILFDRYDKSNFY